MTPTHYITSTQAISLIKEILDEVPITEDNMEYIRKIYHVIATVVK